MACIVQLVIFYKQGAVATPFLNYGMYSGKMIPQRNYAIYKIYANGTLLKGSDFSIQDWDKLYVALQMYLSKNKVNSNMAEVQNRLLYKLKMPPITSNNSFFTDTAFTDTAFLKWYKEYLSSITNKDIHDIKIFKQTYIWDQQYLQPGDSAIIFQYKK